MGFSITSLRWPLFCRDAFYRCVMCIHLIWSDGSAAVLGESNPETYLSLLTIAPHDHGFPLLLPRHQTFGNYFLPISDWRADMAFPSAEYVVVLDDVPRFIVLLAAFL